MMADAVPPCGTALVSALLLFILFTLVGNFLIVNSVAEQTNLTETVRSDSASISLQYAIDSYSGQERVGRSLHEFRASGWRNWTDVTIKSSGKADGRPGKVQRYEDGVYTLGDLANAAELADSGFLQDNIYRAFPENSIRVSRYNHEPEEVVSPGPLFNAGNGRKATASEGADIAAAPATIKTQVARRIDIDKSELGSDVRILAACPSGIVKECKRKGMIVRRAVVYHEETNIPLQVTEQGHQENEAAVTTREMKVIKLESNSSIKVGDAS
jgi:hypothetical protein